LRKIRRRTDVENGRCAEGHEAVPDVGLDGAGEKDRGDLCGDAWGSDRRGPWREPVAMRWLNADGVVGLVLGVIAAELA
jgi:hypothetical protein